MSHYDDERIISPKMLKFIIITIVVIVVAFISFLVFTVRVKPGEVGIQVDMYGSDKGVQIELLKTGRNFYNAITHDVIKFPTYVQQTEYEDIRFQDVDGLSLGASVGLAYKFSEEDISKLYEEYRRQPHQLTKEYFPMWIRNAMVKISAQMKVDDIYGLKKEEFRMNVLKTLQDELSVKGITVDNLYFTKEIDIPPKVKERIDEKIEANQIAEKKQNELNSTIADAEKKVAEEEGKARSRIIESESRATAIQNLNKVLTPEYMEFRRLEMVDKGLDKWNGVEPLVVGASGGQILDLGQLNTLAK